MSLPRGLWDRHIALLTGIADVPRPVMLAEVVDLSRYSTVGASFLGVKGAMGDLVWAVYRDGPAPPLSMPGAPSYVQIKRGDAALDARWYAWPLPYAVAGCQGYAYASAQDVTGTHGGEWAILRYDLLTTTWTRRSASPVVGTYARRPLRHSGAGRLWTWGVAGTEAAPGAGSAAYYSDDGGATWTDCGLGGVRYIGRWFDGAGNPTYAALLAVTADGAAISRSTDNGTTWATVAGAPQGGGTWLAVQADPFGQLFAEALATSGSYASVSLFAPDYPFEGFSGQYGPYGPGGTGFGALLTTGDGWLALAYGDGYLRGKNIDWVQAHQTPQTLSADAGAAVAGGPGAAAGRSWFATAGAGGTIVGAGQNNVVIAGANDTDNLATLIYDATNHPTGLDVGSRGAARVWYTDADGFLAACWFAAVDDADPATPKFVVGTGADTFDHLATPWQDATTRMLTDLGAVYVASPDGVAATIDGSELVV